MSLYESVTIILFDEALKYVSTRCAITNLCLDSIWNWKYNSCSNQCDGHQDNYRNRIHCMESHYSDINGLQYASNCLTISLQVLMVRYISIFIQNEILMEKFVDKVEPISPKIKKRYFVLNVKVHTRMSKDEKW